MSEHLTIPQNIEILPPSELAKFREDLATMEKLHLDLAPVLAEAKKLKDLGWKSWSPEQRRRAGELVNEYKRAVGDAEATIERYKKAVNRFKEEYILKPERKVNNAAEEIKAVITPGMADWDREDERVRQMERDRIARETQAELDRQAEVKRQADEKLAKEARAKRVDEIRKDLREKKITKREAEKRLREAGAIEESLKARASAEEDEAKEKAKKTADTVKVGSLAQPVHGNVKRVNYSAVCEDHRMFLSAAMLFYEKKDFQSYERMMAVVGISDQALSAEAKKRIKTSPEDTAHDLTVAEFEKLYPFVKVKESRTY